MLGARPVLCSALISVRNAGEREKSKVLDLVMGNEEEKEEF